MHQIDLSTLPELTTNSEVTMVTGYTAMAGKMFLSIVYPLKGSESNASEYEE